ncbi:unnamed protein product [Onchocerca ochengi]|uniref:BZIP domain-containing protein n=1 Tax=Onchocerca ochengi TaxID=42157 RepID=A0A182EJ76_ONCOC|nr:unnamed protein product [Onchocerca ochengi]
MTKIFALNPTGKESDEKPKQLDGIAISPTIPSTTIYPVHLPITSIVAKKRSGISYLVVILLCLTTVMLPYIFFKITHRPISNEVTVSGSTLSWAQQSNKFGIANDDGQMIPQFYLTDGLKRMIGLDQNGYIIQDNRDNRIVGNQGSEIAANNDGETRQSDDNMIPDRFAALKAITTLLRIPGVQQVAVIQNNNRIPDNMIMTPESRTDEKASNLDETPIMSSAKSLTQPQVPFVPQMEAKDWEMMNYRRAMREWLLRREMFRRRMIAEMEREAAERRMAQFIMEQQQAQQQQQQQQQQVQQQQQQPSESSLPLFLSMQMRLMNAQTMRMRNTAPSMMYVESANMQSPMEMIPTITAPITQPVITPRIPPMYPFMFFRQQQQLQQQLEQQQQQQQQLQQQQKQRQQQLQQQLQQQIQQQQQLQQEQQQQEQQEQQQQQPIMMPIKLMPPQVT